MKMVVSLELNFFFSGEPFLDNPSQAKRYTNTKTQATMPRIGAPGTNMKVRVDGDDVKVYPER